MKLKKISLIALLLVLTTSCDKKNETTALESTVVTEQTPEADNNNVEEKINPEDAPVLALKQDVYDFGDVKAGSKTDKVIEFVNNGKTPLLIQKASASCGCTVPEFSKEPVAPGETGKLTVSYSAPNTNGAQSKTVTLHTNTAKSIETFKIKANVVGGKDKPVQRTAPAQNLPKPNLGNIN